MKIKQMGKIPAGQGVPYTEGYAENVDPKTGVDKRDVIPGGIESMPVNVVARDDNTTHQGDMGRLGKSE
jgi:hypothetical protein